MGAQVGVGARAQTGAVAVGLARWGVGAVLPGQAADVGGMLVAQACWPAACAGPARSRQASHTCPGALRNETLWVSWVEKVLWGLWAQACWQLLVQVL